MKDFDLLKPDRIEKHQDVQDRKEITFLGSLTLRRGQKVFGYLNGEIFEIKLTTKLISDAFPKSTIEPQQQSMKNHRAFIKEGTAITFAINYKNAVKKFSKCGLMISDSQTTKDKL